MNKLRLDTIGQSSSGSFMSVKIKLYQLIKILMFFSSGAETFAAAD